MQEEQIEAAEQEITEKTAGRATLERLDRVRYGVADGQVVLF